MRVNNVINQGFTLIEIAMVTVIFSLMMNLFGYGLLAYQKKQKYDETKRRLTVIEHALDEFLEINGRLPCVARVDRRSGQAGFGAETSGPPVAGEFNCRFGIAGTSVFQQTAPAVGGTPPHWNRVGSVPVRTLNLPDEYIGDAWGSRFTYIVSERQASESSPGVSMYRQNSGAINVVDKNGNSVIDQVNQQYTGFNNFAEYVVISHGEDKKGGPSLSNGTVRLVPCPPIAGANAEVQGNNCRNIGNNWNITISDVIDDGNYDDLVRYKAGTNRNEILPSGAVIGFDGVYVETGAIASGQAPGFTGTAASNPLTNPDFQCPVGWRAFDDARGRFIMGATGFGTPIERVERSNTVTIVPTPPPTTRNYENLGQAAEDGFDVTTPPYVTTLFCEKQ
jgi:prepilin-type N-terminal cleavage/methylation domain-containing protein